MPELGSITLPALYVLTAALLVAVAITQDGAIPYYVTAFPRFTAVVLAIPLLAWALRSYPLLVLTHIVGAFVFVGAHSVSVFVAFQVPKETEGPRAEALLLLSASSLGWFARRLGAPDRCGRRSRVRGAVVGSGLDLAVA